MRRGPTTRAASRWYVPERHVHLMRLLLIERASKLEIRPWDFQVEDRDAEQPVEIMQLHFARPENGVTATILRSWL